jgi:hypothetical protein
MQDICEDIAERRFHVVSPLSGEEGIRWQKRYSRWLSTLDVMKPIWRLSVLTVIKIEALSRISGHHAFHRG